MTSIPERFKVHPKIVSETIDGEVIILNLDRGRYYSLTQSGTEAWTALAQGTSAAEIVDLLRRQYEGPTEEMSRAVEALLVELRREELISELPPEPAGEAPPLNGAGPAVGAAGGRKVFQAPLLQAYTDMEDLLLLDPIHEVDESGWPNRS